MKTIHLQDNETIVLVLHRHWFVIARELVGIGVLLFFGIGVLFLQDNFYTVVDASLLQPLSLFLFSLYVLLLLALSFAMWINYRLDVWIVTSKRIVDVEQRGLFNREVSEFLIARVQDVTTETPNFITTVLNFGNLTIQTAGHKNFYVREVPKLEEAKRLILEYSHKARKEEVHYN